MTSPRMRRPAGFTLVEILVVIAIIAILAGLLLSAVNRVRSKAQEVSARSDFSQIDTALSGFRAKFNAHVECHGDNPAANTNPTWCFRLASAYQDTTGAYYPGFSASSPEIIYLRRLFPRIDLYDNGLRRLKDPLTVPTAANLATEGVLGSAPILLDPNQCMVFFLSGGSFMQYLGFASSPTKPFDSSQTTKLAGMPFFEFKKNRMIAPTEYTNEEIPSWGAKRTTDIRFVGDTATAGASEPWFLDSWGNPFLFLSAPQDNAYPFDGDNAKTGIQVGLRTVSVGPWGGPFSPDEVKASATGSMNPEQGVNAFRESNTKFQNPRSYQLISAGKNGKMGPGSVLKTLRTAMAQPTYFTFAPFAQNYTAAKTDVGGDDLSNFATTILAGDN